MARPLTRCWVPGAGPSPIRVSLNSSPRVWKGGAETPPFRQPDPNLVRNAGELAVPPFRSRTPTRKPWALSALRFPLLPPMGRGR